MKKAFLSLAMLLSTMAVSAQSEAYVGDMNDDGELNISDVTQLVNTVIGKQAPRKVSLGGGDPYAVDNSAIAGTWRTTSGEVLTFNADGTCTINNTAYTFKCLPNLGFINVYDAEGCPLSYNVLDKTKDMLLLNTMAQTGGKFYYTSAMFVTAIKLSSTSVNLNTGQTHQLTATVTPSGASTATVIWTSSDPSIVTVDKTGKVTAVGTEGKATITAKVIGDGSPEAKAEVTIDSDKSFTVNGVTFTMKRVEGGTFTMGATSEQVNSGYSTYSNETPIHSVTLSDYYIGETEVTQALWKAVMNASPSSSYSWSSDRGLGDSYPAYYISYDECKTFISKLNSLTGATFRMPTEAEWEYAARGGKESKGYVFSGSNTIGDVAWYTSNSSSKTHPVATKQPNELGIYDMSGNVWEWCSDWFGNYSSSAQTNPTGASSGSCRVYRGGGWNYDAGGCRVAYHNYGVPSLHGGSLGLRLALQ